MIGHRVVGLSSLCAGDIAEARAHYDQAIVLYDPAVHRPMSARFVADIKVIVLSYRSLALWILSPRSPTPSMRSGMRARWAKPELFYSRSARAERGSRSYAEITRQHPRKPTSLSLWRPKRAPSSGRRSEYSTKVACWR